MAADTDITGALVERPARVQVGAPLLVAEQISVRSSHLNREKSHSRLKSEICPKRNK